jgi:hypothetical protein
MAGQRVSFLLPDIIRNIMAGKLSSLIRQNMAGLP